MNATDTVLSELEYYLRSKKIANFACLGDEILAFDRNVMSFQSY